MSRKFSPGEGADGLFLKTLTECIGRVGAIDPAKKQALVETFHAELAKNPRVTENLKDAMRHEGTILERMFSTKNVALPAPAPIPPKADVVIPIPGQETALTIEDFGLNDADLAEPVNPYIADDGVLAGCLDDWMTTRKHPYVRTVLLDSKKYLVIGTAVVHGQDGSSININCTTGAFKKIRECDENILVHFNGRPVTMSKDGANGTAFFVWLCHYSPGRVFRFWMNRQENGTRKDDPRGTFRILITNDLQGWRKVAA